LAAIGENDPAKLEEADKLITNALEIFQNFLQSFSLPVSDIGNDKGIDEGEKLLKSLTEHFLVTGSQALKLQIHELIKYLLETDNNICSTFYEIGFKLFSEFLPKEPKEGDKEAADIYDFTKTLAVDIINKSIIDDNYNAKMYINKYSIIENVNKMHKFNSKLINMSILKFHKSLILTGFKPYVTEMIKLNLLDPCVDIFDKITNKRNMIASIALELFALIDRKSYYELAKHLCEKHEVVRPFLRR
jgi:hypothetical protein